MSDWDGDGDEDFTDGVIEGAFWFGPWWVCLLILLGVAMFALYRYLYT